MPIVTDTPVWPYVYAQSCELVSVLQPLSVQFAMSVLSLAAFNVILVVVGTLAVFVL